MKPDERKRDLADRILRSKGDLRPYAVTVADFAAWKRKHAKDVATVVEAGLRDFNKPVTVIVMYDEDQGDA